MTPVLGYWGVRGFTQPIRLMLNYAGVQFEDKKYYVGPGPDFNQDMWYKEKFNLQLDFPNLPYYIDGDVRLTQSIAISRYIARKHGLMGKTEEEQTRVDLLSDQTLDFRMALVEVCYSENYEQLKPLYLEKLPITMNQFEAFLGSGKWFAGENITYVDFNMYEYLDQHRTFEPTCLDGYPKLQAFMDRFEALQTIKAYMDSDKFMKTPIYNKMARWGNE